MNGTLESERIRCRDVEKLEARVLFATDFVLDWNAVALQTVADDHSPLIVSSPEQRGPTRTSRALAIVHAAIFDAVNSIDPSYEPYLVPLRAPRGTSMGAAVATAAHDTLAALYPRQKADFRAALKESLAEVPNGVGELLGVAIGKFVASQVLRARRNDGADRAMSYSEPDEPGVFQTFPGEPAPLGPQWGKVTPFTMKRGSQFRAPPPPALDSAAYAAAYNEVKDYGGDGITTPTLRSAEQTHVGIYWGYDGAPNLGTPPRLYNQIARTIANQEGNTQVENARMFALINLAMADAGIASWETKYAYDLWRPIRGIRQVDSDGDALDDGNAATVADPDWTPLGAPYSNSPTGSTNFTPPFPAYVSGHATFGAALFQTLTRFYGSDDIAFTFTSDEYNGTTWDVDGTVRPLKPRSFSSFSQASEENGQSRIYLGVHWAFDKTEGIKQGNAIANYAFNNYLEPTRSHRGKPGQHDGHVVRLTLPASPAEDRASDDGRDDDDRPSAARDVL
jgi:hypothetical protein